MKTLILVTQQPDLAVACRAALPEGKYRLLVRASLDEAEPLLSPQLVAACLLDSAATGVQTVWAIQRIRRRSAALPLLVLADTHNLPWEEEAYRAGVTHVLALPLKPVVLMSVLDRVVATSVAAETSFFLPSAPAAAPAPAPRTVAFAEPVAGGESLRALREFATILGHSLSAPAMFKQFFLLLRDLVGVNRAAVFLRDEASGNLRAAAGLGVNESLLAAVELSPAAGLGAHLGRHLRIVRRLDADAAASSVIHGEFDLLGMQVAVPVLNREALIGIVLFDGRITGEPLGNSELTLIYHLLAQVGAAVANVRLHDQLAANHEMLGNVLRHLGSACVVVDRDLAVRHANRAALKLFAQPGRAGELDFADLPPALAGKIHQVAQTGAGVDAFDYSPPGQPEAVHRVTVVPICREGVSGADSVLLVADDQSLTRHVHRLQLESAQLRLLKAAGDRIAHEVGNALVPLATYQQLLPAKLKDGDLRKSGDFFVSLETALNDGVSRIGRLVNQMRFITRDAVPQTQPIKVSELIEEAFKEARRYFPAKSAKLRYEAPAGGILVEGDPTALRLALAETIINALQANPDDARVNVRVAADDTAPGKRWARIEVEDNGAGFSAEAARRGAEPFYTTRNVGLGLGLTVSQRIIDAHRGKLEIPAPQSGQHGLVRISLPAQASVAGN